jgi:hypothetical protein
MQALQLLVVGARSLHDGSRWRQKSCEPAVAAASYDI